MLKNSKGTPLSVVFFGNVSFFSIFHKRVPNSPKLWYFEVLLLFLSLRYGTDLDRADLLIIVFRQCFSDTPEVSKIVLPEVLPSFKAPNCDLALATGLQELVLFQHNIRNWTRQCSSFQSFQHCDIFSKRFFHQIVSPINFG